MNTSNDEELTAYYVTIALYEVCQNDNHFATLSA